MASTYASVAMVGGSIGTYTEPQATLERNPKTLTKVLSLHVDGHVLRVSSAASAPLEMHDDEVEVLHTRVQGNEGMSSDTVIIARSAGGCVHLMAASDNIDKTECLRKLHEEGFLLAIKTDDERVTALAPSILAAAQELATVAGTRGTPNAPPRSGSHATTPPAPPPPPVPAQAPERAGQSGGGARTHAFSKDAERKKFTMKKPPPCLQQYTDRDQNSKKAEHALHKIEQHHQQDVDPALRLWLSNKLPEKDAAIILDKFMDKNANEVRDVNGYLETIFRNYANERLAASGAKDGAGNDVGGGGNAGGDGGKGNGGGGNNKGKGVSRVRQSSAAHEGASQQKPWQTVRNKGGGGIHAAHSTLPSQAGEGKGPNAGKREHTKKWYGQGSHQVAIRCDPGRTAAQHEQLDGIIAKYKTVFKGNFRSGGQTKSMVEAICELTYNTPDEQTNDALLLELQNQATLLGIRAERGFFDVTDRDAGRMFEVLSKNKADYGKNVTDQDTISKDGVRHDIMVADPKYKDAVLATVRLWNKEHPEGPKVLTTVENRFQHESGLECRQLTVHKVTFQDKWYGEDAGECTAYVAAALNGRTFTGVEVVARPCARSASCNLPPAGCDAGCAVLLKDVPARHRGNSAALQADIAAGLEENGCLAAVVGVCLDNGADAIVYVRSCSEAKIVTDKRYSTIQTQEAPAEVMLLVLPDPALKGRLAKAVEKEAARKAAREKEGMHTATELHSGGDERLQTPPPACAPPPAAPAAMASTTAAPVMVGNNSCSENDMVGIEESSPSPGLAATDAPRDGLTEFVKNTFNALVFVGAPVAPAGSTCQEPVDSTIIHLAKKGNLTEEQNDDLTEEPTAWRPLAQQSAAVHAELAAELAAAAGDHGAGTDFITALTHAGTVTPQEETAALAANTAGANTVGATCEGVVQQEPTSAVVGGGVDAASAAPGNEHATESHRSSEVLAEKDQCASGGTVSAEDQVQNRQEMTTPAPLGAHVPAVSPRPQQGMGNKDKSSGGQDVGEHCLASPPPRRLGEKEGQMRQTPSPDPGHEDVSPTKKVARSGAGAADKHPEVTDAQTRRKSLRGKEPMVGPTSNVSPPRQVGEKGGQPKTPSPVRLRASSSPSRKNQKLAIGDDDPLTVTSKSPQQSDSAAGKA